MRQQLIIFITLGLSMVSFTTCESTRNPIDKTEVLISVTLVDGRWVWHPNLVKNWVAKANFTDTTFIDGWSYLEVETNKNFSDSIQSFSAGFAEGAASHTIIYNSWRNTQEGFCEWKGEEFCENLRKFVKSNYDWMKNEIEMHRHNSSFWYQVELVLSQLVGLYHGYKSASSYFISFEDILLMNMSGDLEDLSNVIDPERMNMTFDQWLNSPNLYSDGRCSAIIKTTPGNSDILVSHVTWNSYQSMLRVQKKYILPFQQSASDNQQIAGHEMVFSSYPAYLHSGDDFYVISSGMVTLETTIGNSNPELWNKVTPEGELQEWIRVIVANRLAKNGREWVNIFKKYNSGTYNNQWMIVDYKLFKPNQEIRTGTLYVLEQIPGFVQYADRSEHLKNNTYWSSYNVASFEEVFNLSGGPALVAKYGNWFSYDKTPRALIFGRDHSMVHDMESLMNLMRYNNYQQDPLSRCNCTPPYSAENAISARNDLNPKNGTYPFAALGHRSHGGTDAKATNADLVRKLRFQAISGPTYDQQPVFKWSNQDFANDTNHFGHPDIFHFPIVQHKWVW